MTDHPLSAMASSLAKWVIVMLVIGTCHHQLAHDKRLSDQCYFLSPIIFTSLQARYANLPASPAGLLGRFAPLGFALPSCSLHSRAICASRSQKFSKKRCVSIDSKCSETCKNAKKKVNPLTHYALHAKRKRRSATLSTPCHPQGPKECPCQVSC